MADRDPSKVGAFGKKMSLGDLDTYEEWANDLSVSDMLAHYSRELKDARRGLKSKYRTLRELIIKESLHNENYEDDATLLSVPDDGVLATLAPVSRLDDASKFRDNERVFTDPEYEALVDVWKGITMSSRKKYNDKVYQVRNLLLRIKMLEAKIDRLHNLQANKPKNSDNEEQKVLRDRLKPLGAILVDCSKLLATLESIPWSKTTQEEKDVYRDYMYKNSIVYNHARKSLLDSEPVVAEEIGFEFSKIFTDMITKLPEKYSEFPAMKRFEAMTNLKLLIKAISTAAGKVKADIAKNEGASNSDLDSSKEKIRQLMDSPSFVGIVTKDNLSQRRARLAQENAETKEEVLAAKTAVELFTEAFNKGNVENGDFLLKIAMDTKTPSSRLKRLLKNVIYRTGLPVPIDPSIQKSIEDARRNHVRSLYGGDIPFEDEEKIIDENGNVKFIQYDFLKKVGDKWVEKKEDAAKVAGAVLVDSSGIH